MALRVLGLAWSMLLVGCGYRFTAAGAGLPEGIRHAYAPVFVNKTPEPGLEAIFTQAMREQLIRAGVAGDSSSEAQLLGEVQSVTGRANILTPGNELASYRLAARISVRLRSKGLDVPQGTVVVDGQEDYLPGRNVLESESNRNAALRRLSESLTRDAYDRLATRW